MISRKNRLRALTNQIRRLEKRIVQLKSINDRFSWYRLIIFVGGLGITFGFYWVNVNLSWILAGITLLIFNVVAWFHRKVERSLKKHEIWFELKQSQIARMNLDWEKIPTASIQSGSTEHPFELDFDITGEKSLHQLLDICVSQNGSRRLHQWLLQTEPDLPTIQYRQSLIQELRNLSLFRDKFQLSFKLIAKERLEGGILLKWLKQHKSLPILKRLLGMMSLITGVNWLLLVLYFLNSISLYWWLVVFGIYVMFYFFNRTSWASLPEDAIFLDEELKKSIAIFRHLERYPYANNQHLAQLCSSFLNKSERPTHRLRSVTGIMVAIGLRNNIILGAFLNAVTPWDFYWAYRLEKEKQKLAAHFPHWLDICFELEALNSLANFAYLNPAYHFPKVIHQENTYKKIVLEAQRLGHPLIPVEQKVCNDFQIKTSGTIVLITGSNMAGKSTFLRTLGINFCLTFAGAPVNAQNFETSLFRIYSCINVNDSVTGGVSQFYAEVKRLKKLLDLFQTTQKYPIFFLIDEIFKGTNNRERLIGSRSYIRSLVGKNGLGVISTHDLELTQLADTISRFYNYHFREEVIDSKMVFDYKLRSGPCPTTNALKIMRLEGLPVEKSTEN